MNPLLFFLLLAILIYPGIVNGGLVAFKYYWNDGSFADAQTLALQGGQSVEQQLSVILNDAPLGINHLHMRVEDSNGRASHPLTFTFYKTLNAALIPIVAAEYFWDNDPGWGQGIPLPLVSGTVIETNLTLNVENLEFGFHHLGFRVKNHSGQWSLTQWQVFNKTEEEVLSPIIAAEYFWDEDPGWGQGVPISVNEGISINQLTELTMQDLNPGLHNFGLRMQNALGKWSFPLWRQAYRLPFTEPDEISSLGWYFTGNSVTEDETSAALPNGSGLIVQDSLAIALTSLVEGQSYLLHVYALNSSGIRSHEVLVPLSPDWTPQHPIINYTGGTIYLSWDSILGAESYKVMAAATPDGPYHFLADTPENHFQETPDEKKFYRVKAFCSD